MIKNINITKKQLTTLNKFTSKDKYGREYFKTIHENFQLLSACDGYKMAVVYKNNDNIIDCDNIEHDYSRVLNSTFKTEKESLKDKFKIDIQSKILKSTLQDIKKEILENATNKKEKNICVNIRISNTQITIDSILFDAGMTEDFYPIVKFKTEKEISITNYDNFTSELTYSFNLKYLLECIELCNNDRMTLYFDNNNFKPLFIISNNVEVFLLPIRPISIEDMRKENIEVREAELKLKEMEKEKEEKEKLEQIEEEKRIDNVIESFKNNEYISSDDLLLICKRLSISIPLKTHGYIKEKLVKCDITGSIYTCGKNTSNTIFNIIKQVKDELIPEVNETGEEYCSNEDYDHLFGKEKGYHEKLEKDKKIRLIKTELSHRDHIEYRNKLSKGELIEDNIISDGLIHVLLKKYYNYSSYSLNTDRTELTIYSRNVEYDIRRLYNDYLSIVKTGGVQEVYEIIR